MWNQNDQIKKAEDQWNRILLNKYFVEIYLKISHGWVIFKIIATVSLENENTLGIEIKKKHFTEAASKRYSSDLYLAATINFNKTGPFEGSFYWGCQ